jgi:peroxisomal 3,2-trans-enoyl-CoA isomerase
MKREIDTQLVAELFGGLERVMVGIPQKEFDKIKNGQKRHKL